MKHPFSLKNEGNDWVVSYAWVEVFRSKSKLAAQAFASLSVAAFVFKKKLMKNE